MWHFRTVGALVRACNADYAGAWHRRYDAGACATSTTHHSALAPATARWALSRHEIVVRLGIQSVVNDSQYEATYRMIAKVGFGSAIRSPVEATIGRRNAAPVASLWAVLRHQLEVALKVNLTLVIAAVNNQ